MKIADFGTESSTAARLRAASDGVRAALARTDGPRARTLLADSLATFGRETVVHGVVFPVLRELAARPGANGGGNARRLLARLILEDSLLALARGWGDGEGPRAVLAGAPDDDGLPLLALGLALRTRGWRITYLGQDAPIATLTAAARALGPSLVVLSAARKDRLEPILPALAVLAQGARLALAGGGATASLARAARALLLSGDPETDADRIAREVCAASI